MSVIEFDSARREYERSKYEEPSGCAPLSPALVALTESQAALLVMDARSQQRDRDEARVLRIAELDAQAHAQAPALTSAVTKRGSSLSPSKFRRAMRRDVERFMRTNNPFWSGRPGATKQAAHKAVREVTKHG